MRAFSLSIFLRRSGSLLTASGAQRRKNSAGAMSSGGRARSLTRAVYRELGRLGAAACRRRRAATQVEALSALDAEPADHVQLVLRLDALGDQRRVHLARDALQAAQELLLLGALLDAAHQRHVDLQEVGRAARARPPGWRSPRRCRRARSGSRRSRSGRSPRGRSGSSRSPGARRSRAPGCAERARARRASRARARPGSRDPGCRWAGCSGTSSCSGSDAARVRERAPAAQAVELVLAVARAQR